MKQFIIRVFKGSQLNVFVGEGRTAQSAIKKFAKGRKETLTPTSDDRRFILPDNAGGSMEAEVVVASLS